MADSLNLIRKTADSILLLPKNTVKTDLLLNRRKLYDIRLTPTENGSREWKKLPFFHDLGYSERFFMVRNIYGLSCTTGSSGLTKQAFDSRVVACKIANR